MLMYGLLVARGSRHGLPRGSPRRDFALHLAMRLPEPNTRSGYNSRGFG